MSELPILAKLRFLHLDIALKHLETASEKCSEDAVFIVRSFTHKYDALTSYLDRLKEQNKISEKTYREAKAKAEKMYRQFENKLKEFSRKCTCKIED